MALGGKTRGNKRSSSVSYASTITTVVFVTLCIFGVWMLTSNSVESPETITTRTAATDTNVENSVSSSKDEGITTVKNEETGKAASEYNPRHAENNEDKEKVAFEDNPAKLPDDAIKADDDGKASSENKQTVNEETNSTQEVIKIQGSEESKNQNVEQQQRNEKPKDWKNQELGDQQQGEDVKKRKENVGSREETTEGKANEEDGEKTKVDVKGIEDKEKGDTELSLDQKELVQEIVNTPFSDDSEDKQKENLNLASDEMVRSMLKPPTENGTETEDQNQEIKQQSPPNESNAGEPLGGFFPKESIESKKSWKTQESESDNEKEKMMGESNGNESIHYTWKLCKVKTGPDYIPCLDNDKALKKLRTTKHFEHRERHCPQKPPTCLVQLPKGYKRPILWPQSRDKIWYHNVPHTTLAQFKGHQNWIRVSGEFLTFPGGGTQFIHGALHYIDFIQRSVPEIKWGKHTRVVLDVGCGVASFGGYLFERDVLTMSFAPKDEHKAQVQFALERGVPAISAVMGSQRLPFPSSAFDLIHCARCRVPWHREGGLLLLELNRVLRPGGYFVWSATPVYRKNKEDTEIWKEMSSLTESMCWDLLTIRKDKLNSISAAFYRKPTTNECYEQRPKNVPPMCKNRDDANAAWHIPLQACMHRLPENPVERGSQWPIDWPARLQESPYWLNSSQLGIYGKPAPQDFITDYEYWTTMVSKHYMSGLGISWSNVRNVMDMRAVYGGFAAALKDIKVWVLNVVNIDSPDTLPIIYERGLFGIYHDWCESFNTYPRSYDLLHADHLFSKLKTRCSLQPVMAEVDRIVRPGGKLIVRDESNTIGEVENLLKSLHWEVHLTFSRDQEGILSAQKGDWRPTKYGALS